MNKIDITLDIVITDQDIDDILFTAFAGGINYWCEGIRLNESALGKYKSEQISRGGSVTLILNEPFDESDTCEYLLTERNFIEGIGKCFESGNLSADSIYYDYSIGKTRIETCYVDADLADTIVQYAVFGDVIFG